MAIARPPLELMSAALSWYSEATEEAPRQLHGAHGEIHRGVGRRPQAYRFFWKR